MISSSGIILPYVFHACHRPLTRKCDLPVNTAGGMSAAMFILIDNYDSFTWNLWHFLSDLGAEVEVIRNDAATVGAYGITLVGSTTTAPAADVVRALLAACPVSCAQCTATGR